MISFSRRKFIGGAAAACAACATASEGQQQASPQGLPRMDLHVHLDNSTIDKVLELSTERGVKFGIVEHAGTKENVYPKVLSDDAELQDYITMLDGKPVYKGVQAEFSDWVGCFSKEMLGKLDFVLGDAMTMPGKDGRRMKLWEKDAEIGEAQQFMDRYVDWHLKVMSIRPLDIMANLTWLPGELAKDYDALWTEPRMTKIIDAALKYGIALEISSGMLLPKMQFLKLAKGSGVKFSFGSNGRYPKMGNIEFSLKSAEEAGLTPADIFVPGNKKH